MKSVSDDQPRIPRYMALAEHLRSQIRSGKLKPGDRLPSVDQLRTEYQVSSTTIEKVHAVLEQDGLVIREPSRGVFIADTTRRPRTGIIGFAGTAFAELNRSLYWGHLLKGLQEGVAASNRELLILNGASKNLWERIDGVIFCDTVTHLQPYLDSIPPDMPCVSILQSVGRYSTISFDEYLGGRTAVNYLYSLGHQRIVLMMDLHNIHNPSLLRRRYEGYLAGLQEAGIPFDPDLVVDLNTEVRLESESTTAYFQQGKKVTREWFTKNWRHKQPTALITQNDPSAMGAIEALQELGLQVPYHMSALGFDGAEVYDYNSLRLSTIEVPLYELGATAVSVLEKQMLDYEEGRKLEFEDVALPVKLREGESTSLPQFAPFEAI